MFKKVAILLFVIGFIFTLVTCNDDFYDTSSHSYNYVEVLKNTPTNFEVSTGTECGLSFYFSQPINPNSFNDSTFTLTSLFGNINLSNFQVIWSSDKQTLILANSVVDFNPNTTYSVKIGDGLRSTTGNPLKTPFTLVFTTGGTPKCNPDEPNDTAAQATQMPTSTSTFTGVITPGDIDYFYYWIAERMHFIAPPWYRAGVNITVTSLNGKTLQIIGPLPDDGFGPTSANPGISTPTATRYAPAPGTTSFTFVPFPVTAWNGPNVMHTGFYYVGIKGLGPGDIGEYTVTVIHRY